MTLELSQEVKDLAEIFKEAVLRLHWRMLANRLQDHGYSTEQIKAIRAHYFKA